MFSKKHSIYYNKQLHIHFLNLFLLVMNMLVFNFQNMMNMDKRYAYQISNYVAYKKTYKKKIFCASKDLKNCKKMFDCLYNLHAHNYM
jgi:thiosulfate reductase cytochrome b subunit